MRNGTQYAKRLQRVYKQLCKQVPAEVVDKFPMADLSPIEQLVYAQIAAETTPAQAAKAFRQLLREMIDLNEVRVSTAREIANVIESGVPNALACGRHIRQSLNAVFERENRVSLDRLRDCGRREARQYLDALPGTTPYVAASVMLWSIGGHAIPVGQRLLNALCEQNLVDPGADISVVQGFLERNIAAADAKHFTLATEALIQGQKGSAKTTTRSPKATKPRSSRKTKPSKTSRRSTKPKKKTASK